MPTRASPRMCWHSDGLADLRARTPSPPAPLPTVGEGLGVRASTCLRVVRPQLRRFDDHRDRRCPGDIDLQRTVLAPDLEIDAVLADPHALYLEPVDHAGQRWTQGDPVGASVRLQPEQRLEHQE